MLYNTDHCFLSVFGSQKQTQSFRKLVSPSKKVLEAFVIHLLWAKIFFVLTQFISVVGVKAFENTTSIYLRDWTVEMQKGQSRPVERLFLVLPKTTEQCYNKYMWKINHIVWGDGIQTHSIIISNMGGRWLRRCWQSSYFRNQRAQVWIKPSAYFIRKFISVNRL